MDNDVSVQETATDAASCKLSAVRLGYWEDAFASMFAKPNRKMPIINRGYYARVRSIEMLIHRFFEASAGTRRQVIVLGAGQDTMYFRLKSTRPEWLEVTLYVELDFPTVTQSKVRLCRRHKSLADLLGAVETNETEMKSQGYALFASDLRDLSTVKSKLVEKAAVDFTVPTLVLSECVLCYMDPSDSVPLLSWFRESFQDLSVVVYEQIRPNDAFGQTMVENIHLRGCDLKSISTYPDVEDQRNRFLSIGFGHAECLDMNRIYYDFLDAAERKIKERLELFDEVEEFHMLQEHYCLVVASTLPTSPVALALRLTK
ncbi:unnamed protein product [Aphanomyces euteiches]|nr:hypothetical protein AeRB84_003582 [Aphanomyces euteiches]